MQKMLQFVFVGLALFFVSGCATIINGTSQKILTTSMPSGATVLVDGNKEFVTPAKLRLERRRDHELVFSKQGYRGETVKIVHVISEAVGGNTLLFGPIGWGIDALNGCQYKLMPDKVHVDMKPDNDG